MARKLIALSFLTVLAALFLALGSVGAQDAIITLKNTKMFETLERPPVLFPHEKHAKLYQDCVQCHHDNEHKAGKTETVWSGDGQPCSQCHKREQVDKRLPLRTAFHENCTGCHHALSKEGSDRSGPVTCGECHVRGK